MQIIGLDCSTTLRNVGLARARFDRGRFSVDEVTCGSADLVPMIGQWIASEEQSLLCVDAPLGWPIAFGALAGHAAGEPVLTSRDSTFNRETDRVVATTIKQTPLRVGADRIAMTAHWALQTLEAVRQHTGFPMPLAWSSDLGKARASVIEVYPAATLKSHDMPSAGYKDEAYAPERAAIVAALASVLDINGVRDAITADADLLDAVVCCLAGIDFLAGKAIPAPLTSSVRKEGWIWVRQPGSSLDIDE